MPVTIVQTKQVGVNVPTADVVGTFDTPAEAGNLLLMFVASDAYVAAGGPPGWIESPGCRQHTFLGHYVWWKIAGGGETSATKTFGVPVPHAWATMEVSGLEGEPFDTSAGSSSIGGSFTYVTPEIVPSMGERFIVGSIGGSKGSSGMTDLAGWTNGFTEQVDAASTPSPGTCDIVGASTLETMADGVAAYSTGATFNALAEARTGIILAFKVAAGSIPVGEIDIELGAPEADWGALEVVADAWGAGDPYVGWNAGEVRT